MRNVTDKKQLTNKPYERVRFRGQDGFDQRMVGFVLECERRLGYELTITQAGYHPGVAQSGGTHDGGACMDLTSWHADEKERVTRHVGAASWHRETWEGDWPEHVHVNMLDHRTASSAAKWQWQEYRAGRNGLANQSSDRSPHPHPDEAFDYLAWWRAHVKPHQANKPRRPRKAAASSSKPAAKKAASSTRKAASSSSSSK